MCGFFVAFGEGLPKDCEEFKRLGRLLIHRGPNSTRTYQDDRCFMMFHRLAIQDTHERSDQPMIDSSGRYVMVFNGEIYNHRTLAQSLISRCVFRTNSDSEVLLNGLMTEGIPFLNRAEGMFAFVLLDTQEKKVVAARDPFGIKPLYYVEHGDLTFFSSEPRPLRILVNDDVCPIALSELLIFRHVSNRTSSLKKVQLLPPGTSVSVGLAKCTTQIYADPLSLIDVDEMQTSVQEVESLDSYLAQTVNEHTMSDVGYALQLSGGIDSSLVAALCRRNDSRALESYGAQVVGYEHDEYPFRRSMAELNALDHTEIMITGELFSRIYSETVFALDAPSPHYGCVALYEVAKHIAKKHRVVLTGEGADEMFGGYSRYQRLPEYQNARCLAEEDHPPHPSSVVMATTYTDVRQIYDVFPNLNFAFMARRELASKFPDTLRQMMALDINYYLASLLLRQDRISMAHGLEARVPFVHWPFAQKLARIPLSLRMRGESTKWLLKRVAEKHLPHTLIHRRKNGLVLPIRRWLNQDTSLGGLVSLLTEPNACLTRYADRKRLLSFVERHRKSHSDENTSPLMQLLNVEVWLRSLSRREALT